MAAKVFDFNARKLQTRECHYATCTSCGYTWVAPVVGKCPRCGSEDTKQLERRRFEYIRS